MCETLCENRTDTIYFAQNHTKARFVKDGLEIKNIKKNHLKNKDDEEISECLKSFKKKHFKKIILQ